MYVCEMMLGSGLWWEKKQKGRKGGEVRRKERKLPAQNESIY